MTKLNKKQMPRLHTERSNWLLIYHDYVDGAVKARQEYNITHAKTELRCARAIRERYNTTR